MFSMFRALLVVLILITGAAQPASAGAFEDALAGDDPNTRLRLLMPLARQGDARAQYKLGELYIGNNMGFDSSGNLVEGPKKNLAEAVKWTRLAADQGHAPAQNSLGFMYDQGQGVSQNRAEAMKWYRLAADQGYVRAQHNLGAKYEGGYGVLQNYAEAMKWFRLAADQGDFWSQLELAFLYEKGNGVPQNYVLAHMWYNLANTVGDPEYWAASAARDRDKVAAKMTPAQIAEAQRLAAEWKPK